MYNSARKESAINSHLFQWIVYRFDNDFPLSEVISDIEFYTGRHPGILNKQDDSGKVLLSWVARLNNPEATDRVFISYISRRPASVKIKDRLLNSPLNYAVIYNNLCLLKKFNMVSGDPAIVVLFRQAVDNNSRDCVKYLLSKYEGSVVSLDILISSINLSKSKGYAELSEELLGFYNKKLESKREDFLKNNYKPIITTISLISFLIKLNEVRENHHFVFINETCIPNWLNFWVKKICSLFKFLYNSPWVDGAKKWYNEKAEEMSSFIPEDFIPMRDNMEEINKDAKYEFEIPTLDPESLGNADRYELLTQIDGSINGDRENEVRSLLGSSFKKSASRLRAKFASTTIDETPTRLSHELSAFPNSNDDTTAFNSLHNTSSSSSSQQSILEGAQRSCPKNRRSYR